MRVFAASCLAAVLVVAGTAADAATLTGVSGTVLVNQGGGYKPAVAPMTLKAGDSVLANPKSGAQIVYSDCSAVDVKPGEVVIVAEDVPCAGAADAAGLGAGGLGANGLLIGGLAVAGGIGIVAGVSGGSDKPASP